MKNQAYNAITAKGLDTMNPNRKKHADQLSRRAHISHHEGETSEGMFLSCHKTEEHHKYLWLLDSG
jgi:hypothetical protein